MTTQSVYLLQTREFINAKQDVYKIGRTTKNNYIRFTQYPKGSVLLFQSSCYDCRDLERRIIKHFKEKYTVKCMIGREYFEGNQHEMIKDMCNFVRNEEHAEDDVSDNIVEVIQCEEVTRDSSAVIQCEEVIQNTQCEEIIQENSAVIHFEEVIQENSAVIRFEEVIQNNAVDTNIVIVDVSKEPLLEVADYNKECDNMKNIEFVNRSFSRINTDINILGCKFCCVKCRYYTDTSGHLTRHLSTLKHMNMTTQKNEFVDPFNCDKCGKPYQTKSGLTKHSQRCKFVKMVQPDNIVSNENVDIVLHKKIDNIEKMMIKFQRNRNLTNNNSIIKN